MQSDWFSLYGLEVALNKPTPDRIPLSDYERLKKRDYVDVTLSVDATRPVRVLKMTEHGVEGAAWNQDMQLGYPFSVPFKFLSHWSIELHYYFKDQDLRFRSPRKFLLAFIFQLHWMKFIHERVARMLFNRRALSRQDRVTLLTVLVDNYISEPNRHFGVSQVLQLLYGTRIWHHPERPQLWAYYSFLLDSLVVSGDLQSNDNAYRIAPKSLMTLMDIETADRRHRDFKFIQFTLAVLTAGLVFVGFADLWFRILQTYPQ